MQKLLESLKKIPIPTNRLQIRLTDFYKNLPETPGIYSYFKGSEVIYVGKAINLKKRIISYFDIDLEPKTRRMVSEAESISYIQVDSELSALLLEARLIRKYMPHYNIAAKDDKHPLYIRITKEEYPRVVTARKIAETEPNLAFYGPFPSSTNVKSVLRHLRRIFPFSDHKLGKRGCLYSHIGLCDPCPSIIKMTNDKLQITNLTQKYKKNIKSIKQILDGDINKLTKGIEQEMKIASKNEDYENAAHYRDQISQIEYITKPQMPTDFYIENPNLYEDQRKKELDSLFSLISNYTTEGHGVFQISNLRRIECYDIAHLAGTNATASMVTFINGEASKENYRHFKIKIAKGGDDYNSMKEIALRRMNHMVDWGVPDLVIVDGGMGQVSSFSESFSGCLVVGIAKHPDRLIVNGEKIKLDGPALNLVSRMRDEAHRFARRYHHSLISNSIKHANNN